jgi:hypothetical protein
MRKTRVKLLKESLRKLIKEPTKQQWRRYKENYMRGLF